MAIRAFQCFRAGTHVALDGRAIDFSTAELGRAALAYDPRANPAALVLGHPDKAAPEYGKVLGLVSHGDALIALADVDENLIHAVRAGRYKNVSASFHMPGNGSNPVPAAHYLRHIGFLGAVPPAVKGMQPLAFAECAQPSAHLAHSPGRLDLYRVARDLQHIRPGLSISDAAIRVERALK